MSKLGDYVNIRTGKLDANASSENGKYPFFTCSVTPLKIDTYSYDCECVLVAGNGDLNVKYYNGKFDAYQRTYIIESKNKNILSVSYLYCFLDKYVETLRKQAIGGVIKYIKIGNLTEADIIIPNINKQKTIVLEIDKVTALIDKHKKQLEKLDELVKARFVEMFGDPVSNPKGWILIPLKKCLTNIENGKSYVCSNEPRRGEWPAILKLSAVTYGDYRPNENKTLLDVSQFIESAEIHSEDLLFTRKNTPELVGMAAYVYYSPSKLMMPDLVFRLNTKETCSKVFLWQLINHKLFRNKIQNLASGSAKSMSNISKGRLYNLEIYLPPIELQNQFADFVKQVEKTKTNVQKSLEQAETLKKALMQKYFG